MSRAAGVGFPNGPVDNAAVFALPSPELLMLSTEGRWHHDAAVRAGKHVTWRAIPRIGKRPAELGWSPSRFVGETINLTDAPTLPITDFVWANELDLNYERGDLEDDYDNLERRYALIGGWALSVVQSLKQWSPSTRIHWPAWTPDHHALDHVTRWLEAARLCDVIDFHAYDSLANIKAAYHAYRNEFSDKPLALTEWHCRGDLDEERRVLAWLAETMDADPLFEAAHFFIWRWHNAPGWWDDRWDIEHNPERLALFTDPPVAATAPHPEPEPVPMPECPPRNDLRAYGLELAREKQIPEAMYDRQIQQESGWEHCRPDGSLKVSSGNAVGVAQIIQRWHPDVDVTDPWASLRYSTDMMAGLYQRFGSWRKALAGYNWGPSNVSGYTKPDGTVVPPWDGQRSTISDQGRHYLDVILGPDWPEPGAAPAPDPLPPISMTEYFGYPDPQPAGTLARCEGVIFHGSRSGKAGNPLDAEWQGTARYEQNNPLGLGWNATIGPGKVAIHFPATQWGHNARAASSRYVGVEIAQPTVNDPLPDSVPTALADYIYDHVWPVWGEVWHFPSHAELEAWGETGQKDGKSDLFPVGDERMNVFREKVYAQLRRRQEAVPPAPPEPEPVPDPVPDPRDARIAELEAVAADRQRRIDELASLLGVARDDYADQLQTVVNALRDLVPSP